MKAGTTYYHAHIDDDGKVVIDEVVLRSIRGPYAYFIPKVQGFTWGKRSKKSGDYGWLDPIPNWVRDKVRIENGVPPGHGLSKSAALRSQIANHRKQRERWKHDEEFRLEYDRDIEALKRRLGRTK